MQITTLGKTPFQIRIRIDYIYIVLTPFYSLFNLSCSFPYCAHVFLPGITQHYLTKVLGPVIVCPGPGLCCPGGEGMGTYIRLVDELGDIRVCLPVC